MDKPVHAVEEFPRTYQSIDEELSTTFDGLFTRLTQVESVSGPTDKRESFVDENWAKKLGWE
jgi:hypothetical protein